MDSHFLCATPDPISKCNIYFNSGDDLGAELSSGVGAPGSIIRDVVPPGASTACDGVVVPCDS